MTRTGLGQTAVSSFPPVRSQRRLHKWTQEDKTDELNAAAERDGEDEGEDEPLVQSLNAMASHLMMNTKSPREEGEDERGSAERDVYITERGHAVTLPNSDDLEDTEEEVASEEGERKSGQSGGSEEEQVEEDDEEDQGEEEDGGKKLKSDHRSTTPRGLTTWTAVNGNHHHHSLPPSYTSKVTVQKIPHEYTISSVLSFSTPRPSTTQEMVVIQERLTPTTEPENKATSKVSLMTPAPLLTSTPSKNKRRPYNKNNKKVAPSKFVKPPLEQVTAEVTSVGETHVVYKTRVSTEAPEMKSTGVTSYYDQFYTTRKPLWPHQMTTRRLPPRRPPFSKITQKPKPKTPAKRPSYMAMATQGTTSTTPPTTTTYYRPSASLITPISGMTVNLMDIPFMDFVRSQIIPRIGLTLISFMASTPLLLSLLGAAGLRRRKRSLSSVEFASKNGQVLFESQAQPQHPLPFECAPIQKKLEETILRRKSPGSPSPSNSFDMITEAFRHLARWWTDKNSEAKSRTTGKDI